MPSKMPTIVVRTNEELKEKIEFISNENNRSVSKEVELLIKNHVKQFENYNGEIKTKE